MLLGGLLLEKKQLLRIGMVFTSVKIPRRDKDRPRQVVLDTIDRASVSHLERVTSFSCDLRYQKVARGRIK